jgi:hypothetical protein
MDHLVITNYEQLEAFMTLLLGADTLNDDEPQEQNYEDPLNLATYYAPLFPQTQRTDEFKQLFKECFGLQSHICQSMPRPLMCNECFQKYIDITNQLINNNPIYKDVILPRLLEIQEMINMVNEHNRVSNDSINLDTIYELLSINMEHYDPPSQTVLDQCTVKTFDKNKDQVETCVICQCDYDDGDQVKTLTCQHQFHDDCVMQWLKNHSTCPICKTSLK